MIQKEEQRISTSSQVAGVGLTMEQQLQQASKLLKPAAARLSKA